MLWELRKYDKTIDKFESYLDQNPGKRAIQILSELCEISPNRSIYYSEKIVEFGLYLLEQESSWLYAFTPFNILMPILKLREKLLNVQAIILFLENFLFLL